MTDIGGYVARARRLADLSQRDLAALLGVGSSTIARWETGQSCPGIRQFEAVLRCAELSLMVVGVDDLAVEPFPADAVRDNGGRRFPAHLDPTSPERMPANRGVGRRYDRPPAKAWCALRPERDQLRAAASRATDGAPPWRGHHLQLFRGLLRDRAVRAGVTGCDC